MGLSLGVFGCAESTTRDDVADAREDLREEQQDTQEAMREGQEEIADARQDAQPYTANRPVMDEDATEAQQEVADARQDVQEEVADQRQEEQQASANLRNTQQQYQATQARDAFVKDSETKLAHIEVEINRLKESADSAEGQQADALNKRIETLENQHARAEEALEELKGAELAQWQAHQEPVRVALNELSQGVSNVR
jgi:hypothetical protein